MDIAEAMRAGDLNLPSSLQALGQLWIQDTKQLLCNVFYIGSGPFQGDREAGFLTKSQVGKGFDFREIPYNTASASPADEKNEE